MSSRRRSPERLALPSRRCRARQSYACSARLSAQRGNDFSQLYAPAIRLNWTIRGAILMKLLKLLGILVMLAGVAVLAIVVAPSVFGEFDSRAIAQARQQFERANRDFMLLEGRGSEIGVRITDAAESGVKV